MLFHILQRSQNFSPAVSFRGTLVVSVEQTVVIAANLESNVERFILVSLSSVAPVAFHTPPVAIGFGHGTDRFVDQIKITLVNYCCRKVLCHLQEIAADVGDLQVFGLFKRRASKQQFRLQASRFRLNFGKVAGSHESFGVGYAVNKYCGSRCKVLRGVLNLEIPGQTHCEQP